MKNILVTGGNGYIGSCTTYYLLKNNYNIIIIDNNSNSSNKVSDKLKKEFPNKVIVYNYNLCNLEKIRTIFSKYEIFSIFHFAAFKNVNESINNPLLYYDNNIVSCINLLKCCKKFKIKYFIFSSSCTVYGNLLPPIDENNEIGNNITNPYGFSKYVMEKMIKDYSDINKNTQFGILRYFNPAGIIKMKNDLLFEDFNISKNLIPIILNCYKNNKKLKIYGNDYLTEDGTPKRDYIHIEDLCDGHIKMFNYLIKNKNINYEIINLGSGKSTSVLNLLKIFNKVNKINIKYEFLDKRNGDVANIFANCNKAKIILNFKTKKTIEDICFDSFLCFNI